MHPENIHRNGYDFKALMSVNPELKQFVQTNKYGNLSIDFSNHKGVKALNTALLQKYYNIKFWDFPDSNLTPPVPGRADYLYYLKDLLNKYRIDQKPVKILDIGTGAALIYPILGCKLFHWQFTASDINSRSLQNAQSIIEKNNLKNCIELRQQNNSNYILKGIVKPNEQFSASICNPPFFKSKEEALKAASRKNKNLGIAIKNRNFSGVDQELWTDGGEVAFIKKYIDESRGFAKQIRLFTSLVSSQKNIPQLIRYLKRQNINHYEVVPFGQGQKQMQMLVWYFNSL